MEEPLSAQDGCSEDLTSQVKRVKREKSEKGTDTDFQTQVSSCPAVVARQLETRRFQDRQERPFPQYVPYNLIVRKRSMVADILSGCKLPGQV